MKFSDERELLAAADMRRETRPLPMASRPRLQDFVEVLAENRWLVLLLMALALLVGGVTTLAIRPVYEANLLIQIADPAVPARSLFGDAANVLEMKTPATAEMEIMRSRMVVSPAAEKNKLPIVAQPRPWPIAGGWRAWLSQHSWKAALFGLGGRARDAQAITVSEFEVPAASEGQTFIVRSEGKGRYSLRHPSLAAPLEGRVGESLAASLENGRLSLKVTRLEGAAGAEFGVIRRPRGKTIEDLQNDLKLVERGRQSGIIEATLRDTDPVRAAAVLNEIAANYVRQNLERKSAEAEKSLSFLDTQLPVLKHQLEQAESAYNAFRSRKGTVSLQDEAKLVLDRSADLRSKLLEAQQNKRELLSRYGSAHPALITLEEQISALQTEIRGLQGRARELPATQQDALRLERDVQVNGQLYQQLRNSALQLQLVREGKIGNARIIDPAVTPDDPVRPKPAIILGAALFAGVVISFVVVLIRAGLDRGVRSVHEIETSTGLNVYSSAIPFSRAQRAGARKSSQELLALSAPGDEAVEGLRQLRTVLQHQMRDRWNNRVVITGPGTGVGVHFIAANLAAVFATGGRRVLLIDADLRRSRLSRYFDTEASPGLADLIAGTCTRKQATKMTAIPQLDFVPAGVSPMNPGDLAISPAFLGMLEQASKEYDTVLLAAPPLLSSAETLSMASAAATVLLVTRARRTLVSEIVESARRLSQAGPFAASGVVLNGGQA